MDLKRVSIFIAAIVIMVVAIWSVFNIIKDNDNQPVRQEQEIR